MLKIHVLNIMLLNLHFGIVLEIRIDWDFYFLKKRSGIERVENYFLKGGNKSHE